MCASASQLGLKSVHRGHSTSRKISRKSSDYFQTFTRLPGVPPRNRKFRPATLKMEDGFVTLVTAPPTLRLSAPNQPSLRLLQGKPVTGRKIKALSTRHQNPIHPRNSQQLKSFIPRKKIIWCARPTRVTAAPRKPRVPIPHRFFPVGQGSPYLPSHAPCRTRRLARCTRRRASLTPGASAPTPRPPRPANRLPGFRDTICPQQPLHRGAWPRMPGTYQ